MTVFEGVKKSWAYLPAVALQEHQREEEEERQREAEKAVYTLRLEADSSPTSSS